MSLVQIVLKDISIDPLQVAYEPTGNNQIFAWSFVANSSLASFPESRKR